MEKLNVKQPANEKVLYIALLLSVVLLVFQRKFFQKETLNEPDSIYYIVFIVCIILTPLLKKKKIIEILEEKQSQFLKAVLISGLFFKYIICFSIILLGITLTVFGLINKRYSNRNAVEYYSEKIIHVSSGTSRSFASIQFYFKGKINTFSDTKEVYKVLRDKQNDLQGTWKFSFSCRKGLFNSYLIEDWEVVLSESKNQIEN